MLEGLVASYQDEAHPKSYCYSWSIWDDLGMSEGILRMHKMRPKPWALLR